MTVLFFSLLFLMSFFIFIIINRKGYRTIYSISKKELNRIKNIYKKIASIDPMLALPYNIDAQNLLLNNVVRISDTAYSVVNECKGIRIESKNAWHHIYDFCYNFLKENHCRFDERLFCEKLKSDIISQVYLYDLNLIPLAFKLSILALLYECAFVLVENQNSIKKLNKICDSALSDGLIAELCKNERQIYNLCIANHTDSSNKYVSELNKASMYYGITAEKICERYRSNDMLLEHEIISLFNMLYSDLINMDQIYALSSIDNELKSIDQSYKNSDKNTKEMYRYWLKLLSIKALLREEEVLHRIKLLIEDESLGKRCVAYYLLGDAQSKLISELRVNVASNKSKREINMVLYFFMLVSSVLTLSIFYGGLYFKNDVVLAITLLILALPIIIYSCKRMVDVIVAKFAERIFIAKLDEKNTKIDDTAVVVPVLISKLEQNVSVVNKLEMIRLSNPGTSYILLCDFSPKLDEDKIKEIISIISNSVNQLNTKYNGGFSAFFRINEVINGEKMPKERKRGALASLCAFIINNENAFTASIGDEYVKNINYIFTVDEDTVISSGAVKALVCAIKHPLNNAEVGSKIMVQPMMITAVPYYNNSYFAENFLSSGYMPSYPSAFGDVFARLFNKSSFCGKGIFEVSSYLDAYYKLPENKILSHDQPEGDLLGCILFEEAICAEHVPENVEQYLSRRHRWIRGDWQNFYYLCFNKQHSFFFKFCTVLNCVFSLSEFGICLSFILLMLFAPHSYLLGAVALLGISGFDVLFSFCKIVFLSFSGCYGKSKLNSNIEIIIKKIKQFFYFVVLLPCNALNSIDAVLVATFRVFVSHKKLLQWDNNTKNDNAFASFWGSPFLGLILLMLSLYQNQNIVASSLVLLICGFSPIFYRLSSNSVTKCHKGTSQDENEILLALAAKTLCYYLDSMTQNHNYLPPDNFQSAPYKGFCDRTSITNIGYGILSIVCGYSIGLLPKKFTAELLNKTVESIKKLEVNNGCHYNWYNVKTLNRIGDFISTVDSGNFCACLLASSQILKKSRVDFDAQTATKIRIILENCSNENNPENYGYLENYNITAIKDFIYNIDSEKLVGNSSFIIKQWQKALYHDESDFSYIASELENIALSENLSALYNEKRKLFYIGYNVSTNEFSDGCYDLFASENLLCSYFALCCGKVPPEHWYALNRKVVKSKNSATLLSWSGTVFETYMPLIFLATKDSTLLGKAAEKVIATNIDVVEGAGTPFGVSESCCCDLNTNTDYIYQPFGLEELALDSKLSMPVFAPYASILAIEKRTEEVIGNIVNLTKLGMVDKYGFYESIDYRYGKPCIAKCFMAHHQGMIMASVTNLICDELVRKAFMNYPDMKAGRLLLYEDMPYDFDLKVLRNHICTKDINVPSMQVKAARLRNGNNIFDISCIGFGIKYNDITITKLPIDLTDNGGKFYLCDDEKSLPIIWDSIVADISHAQCNAIINGIDIKCNIYPSFKNDGFTLFFTIKNNTHNFKIAIGADVILNKEINYEAHPHFNDIFIRSELNKRFAMTYIYKNGGELTCATVIKCFCDGAEYFIDRAAFYKADSIYAIEPEYNKQADAIGNKMLGAVMTANNNACVEFQLDYSEKKLLNNISFISPNEIELRLFAIESGKNFIKHNGFTNNEAELYLKIAENLLLGTVKKYNITNKLDISYKIGLNPNNKLVALKDIDEQQIYSVLKVLKTISAEGVDVVVCLNKEDITDFIKLQCEKYSNDTKGKAVAICDMITNYLSIAFCIIDGFGNGQTNKIQKIYERAYMPGEQSHLGINTGFADDGYYILGKTLKPWSNILSNGKMGCIVCNDGAGFTFGENAAIKKLTLQPMDRIKNIPSEILYLKNEIGDVWTITSKPINNGDQYAVKHGFGYSVFYYSGFGLKCELTVFISLNKNVKCYNLKMENISNKTQILDIGFIANAFIGEIYGRDKKYCGYYSFDNYAMCENETDKLYLFGGEKFGTNKSAFLRGGLTNPSLEISTDIADCLCATKKVVVPNNAVSEISFLLSDHYVNKFDFNYELQKVVDYYDKYLSKIEFNTNNYDLDKFISNWLPYQTLNSRFLARCGYYQCGGAFGFRDQLQDCLALMYLDANIVRSHIINCAKHQFEYGDVLHWWHSDALGVRTMISDDRLWLIYVACKYAEFTGDNSVFNVNVNYLVGSDAPQSVIYTKFERTLYGESIYEHCKRALKISMTFGPNGLPLILGGDWNDGMDEIGAQGRGESVWLGWFILKVCDLFEPFITFRNDENFLNEMTKYCKRLLFNLENFAWREDRYIRAINDQGVVIGQSCSEWCKIDSIAQSWAVLSGFCDEERGKKCLLRAYKLLYDDESKIFKLFYPPFDVDGLRAGYINDYPQGVRENGGQYTHGAIWFARALLTYGEADKAWNVLKCCIPFMRGSDKISTFGNEPYVASADIYLNGEGGWSWYTGSSGWLYTTMIESVFGICIRGNELKIDPCLPSEIKKATVTLNFNCTRFEINYRNPFLRSGSNARVYMDGKKIDIIKFDNYNDKCIITVIV